MEHGILVSPSSLCAVQIQLFFKNLPYFSNFFIFSPTVTAIEAKTTSVVL